MIPRAHVTAWRKHAPWLDDAQVEQDLLLSRAIVEMFTNETIAKQLAFRGGTALHKLFFNPPGRYSEDIDLVQLEAGPIGPLMTAVHDCLDPWMVKPTTKQGEGRVTLLYRFMTEHEPVEKRRLKIEMNTREHFSVFGLDRKRFAVSSPWYSGEAAVPVYRLDELLGTKLRALYQRKKGRDLFDLATALIRGEASEDRILESFQRYMEHVGSKVSRAQFEANLAAKAQDRAFIEDLDPLLALDSVWDFTAAIRLVSERLVARLPGEPWKGSGVA